MQLCSSAEEIKAWLKNKKPGIITSNHRAIRNGVTNFALTKKLKGIVDFKNNYGQLTKNIENRSWIEYWNQMRTEGVWVDHIFVQMAAWYLELDIKILTTSSKPPNPYIIISGNVNKVENFVSGPPLLIGNYTNVHYQSLLPSNLRAEPTCSKLQTIH